MSDHNLPFVWTTRRRGFLTIPRAHLNLRTALCFLLPVLTAGRINIVGELLFSDITSVFVLFIMLISRRGTFNFRQPLLKGILLLLLLWFAGAVVSDLAAGSPFANLARGWIKIILLGVYITVFFVLIDGREERAKAALLGAGSGLFLLWGAGVNEYVQGSLTEDAWKYGPGFGVSLIAILLIMSCWSAPKKQGLAVLFLSPLHLMLGARSLFLTTFLSGILAMMQLRIRRRKTRTILLCTIISSLFLVIPFAEAGYDQLMRSGIFGPEVLNKHLQQTTGNNSILLGGRKESLISLQAISDSPFIGHGSWAENRDYRLEFSQLQEQSGMVVNWTSVMRDTGPQLIPSHSYLLGAWVENGIAGAIFWIAMMVIVLRALGAGLFGRRAPAPIEFLVVIWTLWNIIFSPFGNSERCFFALYLAISVMMITLQDIPPPTPQAHNRSKK